MLIPVVIFVIVMALLMLFLMGGNSEKKPQGPKIIGCPPGFKPSLAYMEKYGEHGIAYDETQKAVCLLHQGTNHSRILTPSNILAAAIVEDGTILAKASRTDDQGKALISSLLTEEMKSLFQDSPESSAPTQNGTVKSSSQTIELKILINDPDSPVHIITFLNMEAKRGGLIYNEATSHAKNWQDLLSFLIRFAGKQPAPTPQAMAAPQHTPIPVPAGKPV